MKLKKYYIFFIFIYILDSFIWIINKILPGRILIDFFIINNWSLIKLNFIKQRKLIFLNIILKSINLIQKRKIIASNCLSLSITMKVLLDVIRVPCNFNLGFSSSSNNKKTPHAWISDLTGKKLYTDRMGSKLVKTYHCDYNK